MSQTLLVINIAGLADSAIGRRTPNISRLIEDGGSMTSLQPPMPALTSTSQATILTGTLPTQHGIVANGWYFRDLALVLNWQRSAKLVVGETLWEAARVANPSIQCANLFWRYATHSTCDVNVVERPTYWADGRKSQDIYTEPGSVRDDLVARLGTFPLFRFWGPAASIESTRWIVDATLHMVAQRRFGLLLTYLSHLDYDHQRYGPESSEGKQALHDLDVEVGRLVQEARDQHMNIAIVSDYAFEPVVKPVLLNRVLREAGMLSVQRAENGELLEPGASTAFAVCDQQVAHVYVNDPDSVNKVRTLLAGLDGVERVLDREAMETEGINHPRSGQLLAIAEPGCWFHYPYWLDDANAPDFAQCVAIHAKPGCDPTELFWRPGMRGKLHVAKRLAQKTLGFRAPFDVISGDSTLVGGSHGRVPNGDESRPVLVTSWPTTLEDIIPMQNVKSTLLARLAK